MGLDILIKLLCAPPFACDFSPNFPNLLIVAKEDGLVHLFDTTLHEPDAKLHHYEVHKNSIFDVKYLRSDNSFLTASGDQSIRLTDASKDKCLLDFFGHTMTVRCLAVMPTSPAMFASGARDGCIRVWDSRSRTKTVKCCGVTGSSSVLAINRCHLPAWTNATTNASPKRSNTPSPRRGGRYALQRNNALNDKQSVTALTFLNDNTLISSGSIDGTIKIWDLRKLQINPVTEEAKPKSVMPYRGLSRKKCTGFADLRLNSTGTRLYANCLDDVVYEYDLTTGSTRPTFVYTGHTTESFYIKFDLSPDDAYLACGSSDQRAHIYRIGARRQQPIILSGNTSEVMVVRWCPTDPTRLVTLADNARFQVWSMYPSRRCEAITTPDQLAGLAERLPAGENQMSPGVQERSLVLSPPTSSRASGHRSSSLLSNDLSTTSAKRRQSNIRCFLLQSSSSTTPSCRGGESATDNCSQQAGPHPHLCEVTFPGSSSIQRPDPLGSCQEEEEFSDSENQNPNKSCSSPLPHRGRRSSLPLAGLDDDQKAMTSSPILRCQPTANNRLPFSSNRSNLSTSIVEQHRRGSKSSQLPDSPSAYRFTNQSKHQDEINPITSAAGQAKRRRLSEAMPPPPPLPFADCTRLNSAGAQAPTVAREMMRARRRRRTTMSRRAFQDISSFFDRTG